MKKLKDYILEWMPSGTRIYSKCQIQLFESIRKSDRPETIIIITELSNNPGRSITNGASQIASTILHQHNLNAIDVKFIEHYIRPDDKTDTWDLLSFGVVRGQKVSAPKWTSGQWSMIAKMIGADKKKWEDI